MADPSPLLLPTSTPAPARERPPLLKSIDDTIEKSIGGGSSCRAQLFQAILAASAWIFDSQQTFINVFTDAPATWHCAAAACTPSANATTTTSSFPAYCSLPASSWAWDRPAHSSIVSEWSLDCINSSVKGFPASAFFFGCLFGGLVLATLADSTLGRKKMLFFSCLSMSLAGILTSLSPNIWVYIALRFVTGFCRATIGTSALVLSTEIVGKRWRDQASIIGFFLFTVGFLSLPALAYVARDWSWRALYLMTSVPALFYSLLVYFLAKESPRWLLVRGKKEEAVRTFRDIAVWNGEEGAMDRTYSCLDLYEDGCGGSEVVGLYSALKMLVEKRWSRRRLLAVMTVGFGIGMVYYGMPLGAGNLGYNLYLSVTFNALAELPSSLLTLFLIEKMNRRGSVLAFTLIAGVCSLGCAVVEGDALRMGVEVVAFFSACTAFTMIVIYTLELFPTCVRNSAVAMVRQALVLGGVFAPVLVAAGKGPKRGEFLPFGVFGLVIGCCGLFVVCLKETRGEGICDTMEEQECKELGAAADDLQINGTWP